MDTQIISNDKVPLRIRIAVLTVDNCFTLVPFGDIAQLGGGDTGGNGMLDRDKACNR